jgi:hypothetical protein
MLDVAVAVQVEESSALLFVRNVDVCF